MKNYRLETVLISHAEGSMTAMLICRLLQLSKINVLAIVDSVEAEYECYQKLEINLQKQNLSLREIMPNRIKVLRIERGTTIDTIVKQLQHRNITSILHSGGWQASFDEELNITCDIFFTKLLLNIGEKIGVERFYYVSSAYGVGLQDDKILEKDYSKNGKDDLCFHRNMQQAEIWVQQSMLQTTIIRASNVIGDSHTGQYSGSNYGLYACLEDLSNYTVKNKHSHLHIISSEHRLNFIHQDVFIESLFDIVIKKAVKPFLHIVSEYDTSPTIHEFWHLWLTKMNKSKDVYIYPTLSEMPIESANKIQKKSLKRVHMYLNIASNSWHFSNDNFKTLLDKKYKNKSVNLNGLKKCMDYILDRKPYLNKEKIDNQTLDTPIAKPTSHSHQI